MEVEEGWSVVGMEGEREWSVNMKYWRNVLLREQASEQTHDWGERWREGG